LLRAGAVLLRAVLLRAVLLRAGLLRAGKTLRPAGWAASLVLAALLASAGPAAAKLRVNGSTTVNPVVAEAAELLRAERGAEILVDTQGGSSGGIAALADGRADVGMSSRPLTDNDHRKFPAVDFRARPIGYDAVALVVSRDVWDGGVRALSRTEMQAIYEGRVRNWQQLGGPDLRIAFFNKEPGRGTWEVFADWLYGDAGQAPLVSHPEVGANEEARTKVAGTRGGLTQLSAAWADGETTFALGLKQDDGTVIAPTSEALAAGRYPMARPLLVITDGAASGEAAALIELLLSARGQALVRQHGYLPLATGDSTPSP
jgi:phosphate transport system substrate-binding protein